MLLGNEVQDSSRNRSHRYVGVVGRGVLVWARPGEALCFTRVGVWPAQLPLASPLPTSSLARLPHVLSTGIESTGHKESIKSSPGLGQGTRRQSTDGGSVGSGSEGPPRCAEAIPTETFSSPCPPPHRYMTLEKMAKWGPGPPLGPPCPPAP